MELKEIVRSSMVGSPEEMVALLKGEIKTLREENKACQHEIKTLREKDKAREKEIKTLREKDKVREKENKTLRKKIKQLESASTDKCEILQDEEGNTYYHNRSTGETSWDPPMMTNPMRK